MRENAISRILPLCAQRCYGRHYITVINNDFYYMAFLCRQDATSRDKIIDSPYVDLMLAYLLRCPNKVIRVHCIFYVYVTNLLMSALVADPVSASYF